MTMKANKKREIYLAKLEHLQIHKDMQFQRLIVSVWQTGTFKCYKNIQSFTTLNNVIFIINCVYNKATELSTYVIAYERPKATCVSNPFYSIKSNFFSLDWTDQQ